MVNANQYQIFPGIGGKEMYKPSSHYKCSLGSLVLGVKTPSFCVQSYFILFTLSNSC